MNQMMIISPQDWGLAVADATSETVIPELGVSPAELDRRIRGTTYEWLSRQFDPQSGAFYGFYGAPDKRFEPPQTIYPKRVMSDFSVCQGSPKVDPEGAE